MNLALRLYARAPRVALALLFVAVSLATRGFLLGIDLLDVDEAMHIVGSWQLLRGGRLYVDFVDNKPPLLYVYYAAAQLLFGRGMLAVHLLTAAVTVPAIAFAVSSFFRHGRTGVIAGSIYLVFGAAYLAHDMHAANCELLMLLPLAWALVLVRDEERGRKLACLFGAGGLIGVAALFKQQAVAWLPVLGVAALLAPRARRFVLPVRLAAILAGVAVPLALTYALFAVMGSADALVFWTLTYNFGYAQQPMETSEILLRLAKYFLPFVAATLGLWLLAPRGWRLLGRYPRILVVTALACSLPIAFIGFRFYPHYFVPLYVPLALGVAPYLGERLRRPLSAWARLLLAYGGATLVSFSVANGVIYLSGRQWKWEEHQRVYANVAHALASDPCREDASMFTWAGPGALFIHGANATNASRFVGPYATICGYVPGNWAIRSGRASGADVIREDHWQELLGDLERNRGTYFLDASGVFPNWRAFPLRNFPRMTDFVASHYDLIGEVDGVRIHRWRGCGAPSSSLDPAP